MDRVETLLRNTMATAKESRAADIEARQQAIDEWCRDVISIGLLLTEHWQRNGAHQETPLLGALMNDECALCHEQLGREMDTPDAAWVHSASRSPLCWPESRVSPSAVSMREQGPRQMPAGVPGITECPMCHAPTPGPHGAHCLQAQTEKAVLLETAKNGAGGNGG